MALWLPRLATDRIARAPASAPPEARRPLALYAKHGGAFALTAADAAAEALGLRAGMALADARAMRPDLDAREADGEGDLAVLDGIAAWCDRLSPTVALDPPHGLFLDSAGCAHLFGGEAGLVAFARNRLAAQGFTTRAAVAPTPGAAWALAHFGKADAIVPSTDESGEQLLALLSPLPVRALRLDPEAEALLRRLGLATIGQILHAPRQPFAARAGQNAMLRLDQAFGRAREALAPRRPPPPVFAQRRLAEPILAMEQVLAVCGDLCADLCAQLDARGLGARAAALSLYGLDRGVRRIALGFAKPERAPAAMLRLFRERLAAAPHALDAEFGFEALRLDGESLSPIAWRPTDLAPASERDPQAEARLRDVLAARLGPARVGALGAESAPAPAPPEDGVMRRPLSLFARPQPIEAMAGVPDGPPLRFQWRRVMREVARAEGPERIAGDWLAAPHARLRDYYRVEDTHGRRYWLYREGAYGEADPPRWFVHGVFA
ncbi:MAG: DNA polymerase Y family protein [Hyphomonadaceae bacterium]